MTTDSTSLNMRIDYVHQNPGEPPFDSNYLQPDFLQSLGYNGRVCNHHVQAAVTMETMFPDLWVGNESAKEWLSSYSEKIRLDLRKVKAAGIQSFAWTDFVVLPQVLLDRYGAELTVEAEVDDPFRVKGKIRPNIKSEFTKNVIRGQIREIFETFPELDGLVVRVGETYLHDLPYHTGGDPILNGVESHVEMLQLLRQEVCENHGKTLIYRTWMSGIDEQAQPYLKASQEIETHPNLYFVIKHCIGDYHRTHRFSPPLGIGQHKQLIEIQCQREYEGKGAFPNYIAAGVIDGFEEDAQLMPAGEIRSARGLLGLPQTAGVFTWSRGGGWDGPYIANDLWCDINARVIVGWAQSTQASTDDILENVLGDLKFDREDWVAMKEVLELSSKAVLRGVTGSRGDINTLWTRDQYLGGFEKECPFMVDSVNAIIATGEVEATIEEMMQAVEIWKRIESLSVTIQHPDEGLNAFIRTSSSYGRIYQQVILAGWTVILLGEQGVRSGSLDSNRLSVAIDDYYQSWEEWKILLLRKECSTIYTDTYCQYVPDIGMKPVDGMGASIARYSKLMDVALVNQG